MNKADISSGATPLRLAPDAGIAIGPILFIIAVLGILAAAIAAGSGSFTTSTTGESHRTKAAALIDIGQNLKIGFDRILSNGTDFSAVIISPASTTLTTHLFSPIGGGITAPSKTMANAPTTDDWDYPLIVVPGIGTTAGQRVAVIPVSLGVCDEINVRMNAIAAGTATTEADDLGDFTAAAKNDQTATWPASLSGKSGGCVQNTNAASAGYYFYQVIGVQ